jgi:hypothetical protein
MRGFDPAELQRAGVDIGPLPDERGHVIDPSILPPTFTDNLKREGLDLSRAIRVVGIISRGPDGGPGLYRVYFEQD